MKNKLMLIVTIIFLFNCCQPEEDPITPPVAPTVPVDPVSYEIPTLTTVSINEVEETKAMGVGNISNNGGKIIISKGMCWATTPNPTLNNAFNNAGSGTGEFSILIEKLTPNTKYYVRSYAKNSIGTAYGNELTFTTPAFVEKICTGDILLTSQEEVDAFAANKCTEIKGNLRIFTNHRGSRITDLSPLISIKSIDGDLDIERNYFTSLIGLQQLTSISGEFRLFNNYHLREINGFNNLTHVGEDLYIVEHHELTTINGFNNLSSLPEGLGIADNSILRSVSGFSRLSTAGWLSIHANPKLSDLDWLTNLKSIQGSVTMGGNLLLKNLNGLSGLTSIDGYIYMEHNDALENLDGLKNLNLLNGDFTLRHHPNLTNFCGIKPLMATWSLRLGFPYYYNYSVHTNAFNPTVQDILDGNCKL